MSPKNDVEKIIDIVSARVKKFGFCNFTSVNDSLITCRAISRIPQNAQGIITVLFPYFLGEDKYADASVSRYACVEDYHIVALKILSELCDKLRSEFVGEEFEPFVDNSPIPEVYAAALSGLGRVGKNGLLLNDEYGTWVFIGEIVTTLSLEDSCAVQKCENCGLCERNCPTGAIKGGKVDKSKCLSDITQRKGELSEEHRMLIKRSGCAWGCDVCQLVCPHNGDVKITDIDEFICSFSPIADVDNLENKAYGWRGRAVIERNIKIIDGE